ncbi:MAG TPA: NAD-binding protein, partial [Zeimonas sp.]
RIGQVLAGLFDAQSIPWVAVDDDPNAVSSFHAKGWPVYVGDASRGDLLRRLGLAQASAVVLTMDQPAAAVRAVRAIRADAPDVAIFARARDERHAGALHTAGADAVIPETLESALQLGALALGRAGMAEAELRAVLSRERDERVAPYANQSSNGSPT